MASLDFSRSVQAPIETVFDVISDHRGMPKFTRFRKVKIEREGDPAPNGLGAIRSIHAVGPPVREEIIGWETGRKLVYKMLSGAPLKDHVGTIELSPDGDATRMSYTLETKPRIPLTGAVLIPVVKRIVEDIASGIKAEAEKRAAS